MTALRFLTLPLLGFLTHVAGAQWIPEPVPPDVQFLVTVSFRGQNPGIAGGWTIQGDFAGRAIYSVDGGRHWMPAQLPDSARALVSMTLVDADTAYCAGAYNTADPPLREGPPRPGNPDLSRPPALRRFREAIGLDGSDNYRGFFLRSTDGGKRWAPHGVLPDSILYLLGLTLRGPGTLFVTASAASPAGEEARILRSTDGGLTWSTLSIPQGIGDLTDICFPDCLNGFAVGRAAGGAVILRTEDGGDTWTPTVFPGLWGFMAVSFPTSTTGYVLGTPSWPDPPVILKTTDTGTLWDPLPFPGTLVLPQTLRFLPLTGIGLLTGSHIAVDTMGAPQIPFIARTTDGGSSWVTADISGPAGLLVGATLLSEEEAFACGGDTTALMFHTTNGGVSSVAAPAGEAPGSPLLLEAYPNPFNGETRLRYRVPSGDGHSAVRLTVFDLLGRPVRTLAEGPLPAGEYSVSFRAEDLPSGVYYCTLSDGRRRATRTVLLIR